jgi:hypothetical protein
MKQLLKMSGNYYVTDVGPLDSEDFTERIEQFHDEGTPSIIFQDYEDLETLGIHITEDDVTLVELDD